MSERTPGASWQHLLLVMRAALFRLMSRSKTAKTRGLLAAANPRIQLLLKPRLRPMQIFFLMAFPSVFSHPLWPSPGRGTLQVVISLVSSGGDIAFDDW